MITSSILSAPEVVWGMIVTGVGAVGTAGAKIIHLDHRVKTAEQDLEEIKDDMKDDLTYLRDRLDDLHKHLLEKAANE